jgi:hypothetical protein
LEPPPVARDHFGVLPPERKGFRVLEPCKQPDKISSISNTANLPALMRISDSPKLVLNVVLDPMDMLIQQRSSSGLAVLSNALFQTSSEINER